MADWKALATQEAQLQGCQSDIVLATVDAETSGTNITGDSGNALGYGQVWPRWHMDKFKAIGKRMGLEVPADLPSLTDLVLGNNAYSMAVAVAVIKETWKSAGYDWGTFTKSYVGPKIPQSDFSRRANIWQRYSGQTVDISKYFNNTGASYTSSGDVSSGNTTYLDIPATNYGIVNGSKVKSDILYGRKYRILVQNSKATALDVSDLRCTFSIVKTIQMEANYSTVVIYNLNANSENSIINEGNRIIVEAGYDGEQYGVIFDGDIIQPIREKENGVTYKLTLSSIDGDRFLNAGFVNYSMTRGQNSRQVISSIAAKAQNPAQLGNIATTLNQAQLTRGKVVFGLAKEYLRKIAKTQNASFYVENGKVNIIKADEYPKDTIVDLSPTSGLIGVPTQTEYGMSGQCLLNPRLKVGSLVHVDNTLIINRRFELGEVVRALDSQGIYRIIKLEHVGDTRGDDWYTNFETVTQAGLLPSMQEKSSGSIW